MWTRHVSEEREKLHGTIDGLCWLTRDEEAKMNETKQFSHCVFKSRGPHGIFQIAFQVMNDASSFQCQHRLYSLEQSL
jgi:hypothetical protein